MKLIAASLAFCSLILLSGCRPSPEKLLATANKYHDNKKYKEADILYQKVIAKDKTNAEAYYRAGLNLLAEGMPGQATRFLRRAVDLKPSNTDASSKLAEVYLTAYMSNPARFKQLMPEVSELTKKILQQDPNSFTGLRLQGLIAFSDRKLDDAVAAFAKANQIKPYSPDVIGWYAESLLLLNRQDEAQKLVRETLNHNKTWSAGYLFLYALAGKSNDRATQEAILREHVRNDPKDTGAIVQLADFLRQTNRFDEGEAVIKRVLADKQAFPAAHEIVGDYYMRARKFDLATQQYEAGVNDDDKSKLRYQQRLVAVKVAEGHTDQALNLAKSLAAANPKDAVTNELYARLLLTGAGGDAGKTLAELKNLVQKDPGNPTLRLYLSQANLSTNHFDAAVSEANEALQAEMKNKSQRREIIIPARLIIARINEGKGQHAQALEQTQQVLQLDASNPEARLLRDQALIGLGESDQAKPDLENFAAQLDKEGNFSRDANQVRLLLGRLYMGTRDYAKAGALFDAVWKATPPDYRGFEALQELNLAQGKTDLAVSSMEDFANKNPANLTARFDLANIQATAGQMLARTDVPRAKALLEAAAGNYKLILKSNTNSSLVWYRLGLLQVALGQTDSALASLDQAISSDSQNEAAHLERAMLLDHLGRTKDAAVGYNRVLGIDPDNTVALNNLAFLNADNKTNLEQAQSLAEHAKKRAPNSPDVADTLGYVYYQRNLNTEALQIFRQAVQQYPQNPTFRFHLAMALLKQGDKQGARDEAEKALKTAPPAQQERIKSFVSQIG
ncbi:MAG TPA: tetratricopeptide repeat protein [Bryobacteraceae bacterium]|nr:tetratricopeptide repeat protein [Bryobacteraceae bacterium]